MNMATRFKTTFYERFLEKRYIKRNSLTIMDIDTGDGNVKLIVFKDKSGVFINNQKGSIDKITTYETYTDALEILEMRQLDADLNGYPLNGFSAKILEFLRHVKKEEAKNGHNRKNIASDA